MGLGLNHRLTLIPEGLNFPGSVVQNWLRYSLKLGASAVSHPVGIDPHQGGRDE